MKQITQNQQINTESETYFVTLKTFNFSFIIN